MRGLVKQNALVKAFDVTKKNGTLLNQEDTEKFFNTLEALSPKDKFSTSVLANGTSYRLEEYQFDSRFEMLTIPRAVYLAPSDLFNSRDLLIHEEPAVERIFRPSEFIEFQYRMLNAFRLQANIAPYESKRVGLDSIKVFSKDGKVFIADDVTYKTLPIELSITDSLYETESFNQDEEEYTLRCMLSMFGSLTSSK